MAHAPITFQPLSSSLETSSLKISFANMPENILKEDGKSILPGLECLLPLDTIFLEQTREEGEQLPGMELENQYVLKNIHGQRLLLASENTAFCNRCCFGSSRPFEVNVYNHNGERVINVKRPCTFGLCCVCGICCGNHVEVTHESGDVIGSARQLCSLVPTFEVLDANEKIIFIIRGPSKQFICGKVNFKIFMKSEGHVEREIGHITKEWGGILKESFSDMDTFGIIFPKTLRKRLWGNFDNLRTAQFGNNYKLNIIKIILETQLKAVLIGVCFLVDYTYFETHG